VHGVTGNISDSKSEAMSLNPGAPAKLLISYWRYNKKAELLLDTRIVQMKNHNKAIEG
jgi:hypothetical protein